MIQISKKHITALLLQPFLYFAVSAAEEPKTSEVATSQSAIVCNVRDESKDKPLEFSAGVDLEILYDQQKGTSSTNKFSPSLVKKDEKSENKINAFMGAYVSLSKKYNIFGCDLNFVIIFEKETGKNSIELNAYGVENNHMKFGQLAGNFNTYLPDNFRYGAKQIAYKHDLGDGMSFAVALEEAQNITIRSKEDEEKTKKKEVSVQPFVAGQATTAQSVKVQTIDDEPEVEKLHTSTRMPKLALAVNFAYKKDWGNIQVSTLITATEYYLGNREKSPSYNHIPMYGATVSGKFIAVHNEEFNDKEATTISAHAKFMNGLAGYQREIGGLPEAINANFCLSKNEKSINSAVKSIGFSLAFKQVWTKNLSSSLSSGFMSILNADKMENIEEKDKYLNAANAKLTPISYNIAKNFTCAPLVYQIAVGNVLTSGKAARHTPIQRFGFAISYDF